MKAQAWVGQEEGTGLTSHWCISWTKESPMKTTSGSLSLLSATNRWCFGDVKEGVNGMHAAAPTLPASLGSTTPTALSFPISQGELREPANSPLPLSPPPAPDSEVSRAGSLTRDIQRPSPCTSCTGVGLLAGFSSPLILAPLLLGRASAVGGTVFREEVAPPRPPLPLRQQWTVPKPALRGERDGFPGTAPAPRGGNLHLGGCNWGLRPPRRPRSETVRRFLLRPLTPDHGGGGWRTQAPGGVGAGETIQHTVGREKPLPASTGRSEIPEGRVGGENLAPVLGKKPFAVGREVWGGGRGGAVCVSLIHVVVGE